MAEAEPADGPRIGAGELVVEGGVVDEPGVVVVVLLVDLGFRDRAVRHAVAVPVAVLLRRPLRRGDELGEHSRESVDLMAAKLGARGRCAPDPR